MSRMLNRRAVLGIGTLAIMGILSTPRRAEANSTVQARNKSIVARWYAEFWGKTYCPAVIEEVASPEITLKHSLHRALIGPNALRSFMAEFRSAFPDLGFELTTPLLADGDRVNCAVGWRRNAYGASVQRLRRWSPVRGFRQNDAFCRQHYFSPQGQQNR
jgi:hypothetical protein